MTRVPRRAFLAGAALIALGAAARVSLAAAKPLVTVYKEPT